MSIDRTTSYRRAGLAADPGGDGTPNEAEHGAPGQDDAQRFKSLMDRPAPGEAVLAGLGVGPRADPPPEAGPAARLVDELAQRLLVGDEAGSSAVRVVARDVGIPGLEVAVRREPHRLVVELLAELAPDLTLLRTHAGELARHLEARFGVPAEVQVRRHGQGGPAQPLDGA